MKIKIGFLLVFFFLLSFVDSFRVEARVNDCCVPALEYYDENSNCWYNFCLMGTSGDCCNWECTESGDPASGPGANVICL